MLDVLLWIGSAFWIVFFLQFVINFLLAHDISKGPLPERQEWPFVSIVVPARNEDQAVEEAVSSYCRQDYPAFEVIVVDDCSTDRTPEILAGLKARFSHLTVLEGSEPPTGWLGKPHALEMGRRAARGEWILFADADLRYAPDLLRRAVAWAERDKAGMLVLPPIFVTSGVMEAVLLSALYLAAVALVPIFLVRSSRIRCFAAGAGAFNLVRREAVEASGVFDAIKAEVVDDVALGYRVKQAGFKLSLALAGPLIRIHMYQGAWETVKGFTKNIYPAVSKVPWVLPPLFLLGFIINLLPYYGLAASLPSGVVSLPALISLGLMHAILFAVVVLFRQPWYVMFLNPLREIGWWFIMIRSFVVYRRSGIVWRGRSYPPRKP